MIEHGAKRCTTLDIAFGWFLLNPHSARTLKLTGFSRC